MASPLAPPKARPRDRADSRSRGRRGVRWAIWVLLLAVALVGFATPAMAATSSGPASTGQASPAASARYLGSGTSAGSSDCAPRARVAWSAT
jgi:hypothetical protein